MGPFGEPFSSKIAILREKMRSKKCFEKTCPAKSKLPTISGSGGSRRSSLACALFRQETVVRATVEALFEIIAEKSELGSKSVQKKLNGLLKIVEY